jgi:hypothetical protein
MSDNIGVIATRQLAHIPLGMHKQIVEVDDESVRPLMRWRKGRRKQGVPSRLVEVLFHERQPREKVI